MDKRPHRTRRDPVTPQSLPALLTSGEVAKLLRTTRRAVYAMVERAGSFLASSGLGAGSWSARTPW